MLRRTARALLATAVVADGWRALRHPREELAAVPPAQDALARAVAASGVTVSTDLVLRGIGATKIVAGALLGLGVAPRVAAGTLAVLHLPSAVAAHPFWRARGQQRKDEIAGLVKDVAVLGGLLLAAADTAGKPSLAWRLDAARSDAADHLSDARDAAVKKVKQVTDH